MRVTKAADPELIRAVREAAGLTQRAAAAMVHVSPNTWGQWERGLRTMPGAALELFTLKAMVTYRAPCPDDDLDELLDNGKLITTQHGDFIVNQP